MTELQYLKSILSEMLDYAAKTESPDNISGFDREFIENLIED
jgi:hypothetical protein